MHSKHMRSQHAQRRASHMPPRGRGRGPGRGRGRGRGRQAAAPTTTTEELSGWFAGNLPDDWFTEPVTVTFDRDEIIVTGSLAMPKVDKAADPAVAAQARIDAFRETTRDDRVAIAQRAEATFMRHVSWTVTCGTEDAAFTVASIPVMTRLDMDERQLLDTLIDAGVARSRSDALAWSVRLVAENESEWLDKLRSAMTEVEELRSQGPASKK